MSPAILPTLFILRWFNDVPHRTEYAKLVAVSLTLSPVYDFVSRQMTLQHWTSYYSNQLQEGR